MAKYSFFNALPDFLSTEYIMLIAFVVFFAIIFSDHSLPKKAKLNLFVFGFLCISHDICRFIDYGIGMGTLPVNIPLRFFCSSMGYIIRPAMIAFTPYVFSTKKINTKWYYLPLALNTLAYLINFITPVCFYIDSANSYTHITATRNLICPIICAVYFFFLIFQTIHQSQVLHNKRRKIIICVNLSIIPIAAVSEMIADINVLSTAILVALILHYTLFFVIRSNDQLDQKNLVIREQRNALMMSQIQPHFIYNTLNVIYYLCQTDSELASETVLKFSDYLRQNLTFVTSDNQLIPVEEELNHVQLYTDIEHLRFPNIKIDFDINDGDYMIPPLSIQPLVENAIRHGVRNKKDGRITISLRKRGEDHIIVIEDNGVGMDNSASEKNDPNAKKAENLGKHTGIGLPNVKERIEHLLGGSMIIKSAPNEGTTIKIKIPLDGSDVLR